MSEYIADKILRRIPQVIDADARAEQEKQAEQASRQQKLLAEEQKRQEQEQQALLIGEQLNMLLDTNPDIPSMPRFESIVVGKTAPREHTTATGEATTIRDEIRIYDHVGTVRPICETNHGKQLSLGDDNVIYTGVGDSSDRYRHRQGGKTRNAKLGTVGAYDLSPMSGEDVLHLVDSDHFQDSIARLLSRKDGFSDQITAKRQSEQSRADYIADAQQQERDKKAADIAKEQQRNLDRQQHIDDQANQLEQLVLSLDLPTAAARAAVQMADGHGSAAVAIADIHHEPKTQKRCSGYCAEDQAVNQELQRIQADYPGYKFNLQVIRGPDDKPTHCIVMSVKY